jgi:hypothetical protein
MAAPSGSFGRFNPSIAWVLLLSKEQSVLMQGKG